MFVSPALLVLWQHLLLPRARAGPLFNGTITTDTRIHTNTNLIIIMLHINPKRKNKIVDVSKIRYILLSISVATTDAF